MAVALVVVALIGWGSSGELAQHADRPIVMLWAIRSGAVAAFFAAQVLGMTYVVGVFYSRGKIGEWTRLAAGFVCTAAFRARWFF